MGIKSVRKVIEDQQRNQEIHNLIDKATKKPKKTEETSTKQQILMLHYLGFLKQLSKLDKKKSAKLLATLLNRHEQNIREYLTFIDAVSIDKSQIKTKDNIESVRALFEEVGLLNEIKLIDKDLENIS